MNKFHSLFRWLFSGLLIAFVSACPNGALAQTAVWKAGINGDWYAPTNWVNDTPPDDGYAVYITNATGSVLLTNTPAYTLASLTLSRPLTFSNWNTTLTAVNIQILSNGNMNLPVAFSNNVMSNSICLVCTNLYIAAGGKINVDGSGYKNGAVKGLDGNGPGGGGGYVAGFGGGAGHGGFGGGGMLYTVAGNYRGGVTYGSASNPAVPGSAGGNGNGLGGGAGGGVVKIDATQGSVTVNGSISANGGNGVDTGGGGGAGGSIWIACRVIQGTNGSISANGGSAYGSGAGGNGGGGRVAVCYDAVYQAAEPIPQVTFSSLPGMRANATAGDVGSLWFTDSRLLSGVVQPRMSGWVSIPGFNAWNLESLVLSNQWLRLSSDGFSLTVSNDIRLDGPYGRLDLGGETFNTNRDLGGNKIPWNYAAYSDTTNLFTLDCRGNLILTNGGSMAVYAARTNSQTLAYGALIRVAGDLWVGPSSRVFACSQPTNGGSVFWHTGRLTLSATNTFFTADYSGFAGGSSTIRRKGFGSGGGAEKCGGSYGGRGGTNVGSAAWQTYGDSNAPAFPGSGGGWGSSYDAPGASGGGLIWVAAEGRMTINGTLSANGASIPNWYYYPGGGSGGGIFLTCKQFEGGANGLMQANGGSDDTSHIAAAGGGGRIAVVSQTVVTSVTFTVQANAGIGEYAAEAGTVVWLKARGPGTVFMVR